jgi:hypothetical protein
MPDEPKDNFTPRSIGELRRLIVSQGHTWTVDARFRDNDPIPKYARGGQPEQNASAKTNLVEDVHEFIRAQPPANPFLRGRWVELGLLAPENRGHSEGSKPVGPVHEPGSRVE